MKVAVSSTGEGLNARTSPVFGRCPYYVIVDVEDVEIEGSETISNSAMNQRGGAGIAAAQTVGNQGAEAVITGAVGPNAFNVLQQLGIDVYRAEGNSVGENVEKFLQGGLEKISGATGGPGMGRGRGRGMDRRRR